MEVAVIGVGVMDRGRVMVVVRVTGRSGVQGRNSGHGEKSG